MQKEQRKFNSVASLRGHDVCWLLLGLGTDGVRHCWGLYDMLVTVGVSIVYPVHLIIGLFLSESKQEIIENLVINVAILPCSIKFYAYRRKTAQMQKIKAHLRALDERVERLENAEECQYFSEVLLRGANRIMYVFAALYTVTLVASLLAFAMIPERRLLYPGWFPFDWHGSTRNYMYAAGYQCFALVIEGVQNLANDVYAPLVLSLLARHVHLVRMRVAKLAHAVDKSEEQHNEELIACVQDYNILMGMYKAIERTVSLALYTQFLFGGLSIGVSVIYMVLYVDNVYKYMYQCLLLTAFFGELFPFCYFGTLVLAEFQQFPYAIFSCNWLERQRYYRRNVIFFMELSLRQYIAHAGGMIGIYVDSFFVACKMAYSFFTLLTAVK